jgi:ribosomal protein L14
MGVGMKHFSVKWLAVVLLGVLSGFSARGAAVPNGNEYALSLVEAKTPAERKKLVTQGVGKNHFFRYLQVLELTKQDNKGAPTILLKTREPSSNMQVTFLVQKSISLSVLQKDPATKVGDAVAVIGVVESADPVKREMVLNPVIVRYKDLLAPKVGKEMLAERDSSAIVYSFTGGKKAVNVSKRDQDLVSNEKEMIEKLGKDGWAEYLIAEIAKRDKAEIAERDKLDIYKKKDEKSAK